MNGAADVFARMEEIGDDPASYVAGWRGRTGGKAFGVFPMNFPVELVHAAGVLPVLVQESSEPVTLGRSHLMEFYCGYTRSIVDQAATGQLDAFDAFLLVDHCVALLGAADSLRHQLPGTPVFLAQFPASLDEDSARREVTEKIGELRNFIERSSGTEVTDAAIANSIALYNRNRQLQRQVYDMRREGQATISPAQMRAMIKSSMVMDVEQHTELVAALVDRLQEGDAHSTSQVRLHLSGHFCHAPRRTLLDAIEASGAAVVDDDLYAGFRFISTDVRETGDPAAALAEWYFDRNDAAPCATRAQKDADWEDFLLDRLASNGAQGIIVLMPKFCEPHMLYFPELKKAFERNRIPYLLIETELEGQAIAAVQTRVEALVELIRHSQRAMALLA